MTPRAELIHWAFAAGFLLLGLILLAEAIVGTEIFAMRRWRVYLWPSIAFAIGVLLWPVSVFFTKLFDLQLQVLGDPGAGVDEVVTRGSIPDRSLLAFHLRDDRLVGAVVSGQGEDLVEELKVLLREQPEIGDRSRLGNEHIRPKAVFAA